MSDPVITLDVPARFWDDHVDRCGDVGSIVVVCRLTRSVRVTLDDAALSELRSDATHYAGEAMSEWWDEGRGVILSARATIRMLHKHGLA